MSTFKIFEAMESSRVKRDFPTWVRFEFPRVIFKYLSRFFTSIEEIRSTIEFPPKSAFFSTLKQVNVTDDEYNESKQLYDSRCSLPDDHPDKWRNFGDFLKYYNLLDVRPLVQALSICFKKFKEYFHVDPGNILTY